MKKVMKFVKGKREDENHQVKSVPVESKKVASERNEKMEEPIRDEDFMCRDKSVTKLHKAVWNENSDKLKSIIKTHDIDITDRLDRTALYFAVLKNNPNIVNLLLENNANQNIPDIDGITPFLKSVQLGYTQCAAILLNYGADIKKTDKDSNSCLHFAVMGKHVDMLTFLFTHHADCNVSNVSGDYPLHIAIQLQDRQLIELLLNHNADIIVPNAAGLTPLVLAEQQDNAEIQALVNAQIEPVSEYEDLPKVAAAPVDQKPLPKPDSDAGDTWNDSPISSPARKPHEKPVTKITKHFFHEETDISEKSESDMSVKCSANTSPQSGIIPPPCKPLRSLEYLQSGLAMENRTVHLLTLGTVRTRHISMTESDHSKNNTPHRYSYQGEFHALAPGDSVTRLPDHQQSGAADERGDSGNVSGRSKLLSKLECDSTMQSDWGSNESLPLDEVPSGGRRDAKHTGGGGTPKRSANPAPARDKTTDTFLQKQFSILEDYEKNHEQHCAVAREPEQPSAATDATAGSDSQLDDIGHLLADNNRINAQLERYAGQSDVVLGDTKSKSLPRNCEPSNAYHKGSFSLPRTLEAGKDPFREMRSYGHFKPRSHFFSLKVLRGEKRSGFIDKLRNMFNKKSQVHLSGAADANGTWLHTNKAPRHDADAEKYYQDASCSASEDSESKKSDKVADPVPVVNVEAEAGGTVNTACINNEQNKVIEQKFLSLSNMSSDSGHSRKSSSSQSHSGRSNFDEESKSHKGSAKQTGSSVVSPRNVLRALFCDECSAYVHLQLAEAEQSVASKEKLIRLLQEQLLKLQARNIHSIDVEQETHFKLSLAQQELAHVSQVCKKYEDELHKLRAERTAANADPERDAAMLREEADKWRKQYEDLIAKINAVDKSSLSSGSPMMSPELQQHKKGGPVATAVAQEEEEDWRSVIQNEVSAVITLLKENSQTVINSLETQNKKLESLVEKLRDELEASSRRQQELEKELISTKNELLELTSQAQHIKRDYLKSSEDSVGSLKKDNKRLKLELENITRMYTELQHDYENNVKKIEKDIAQSSQIASEFETVKGDYKQLTSNVSELAKDVARMRDEALARNEDLREQFQDLDTSVNVAKYLHKVTHSLDNIVKASASTPTRKEAKNKEESVLKNCRSAISDVAKIHKINSNMEYKLKELGLSKTMSFIEDENMSIKEDWVNQSRVIENLEDEILHLKAELSKHSKDSERLQEALQTNDNLMVRVKQFDDTMQSLCFEIEDKESTIKSQCSRISVLSDTIKEFKGRCDDLVTKTESIYAILENEKKASKLVLKDNEHLRVENRNLQCTIIEAEKQKEAMDEELKNALLSVSDLKRAIAASYGRVEKLETANDELKKQSELLVNCPKPGLYEKQVESYKAQVDVLQKERKALKEQHEKEKVNSETLQKRLDALQALHDNEVAARAARCEELKTEKVSMQSEMQRELDELRNDNKMLREKIGTMEGQNKALCDKINGLIAEIKELNGRMHAVVAPVQSTREVEVEMESTICKEHEQPRIVNETLSNGKLASESTTQLAPIASKKSVHFAVCESNGDGTAIENADNAQMVREMLLKQVSSIENQLNLLSNSEEEFKSASMPNLDELGDPVLDAGTVEVLYSADAAREIQSMRISSSLECVSISANKTKDSGSVASEESCRRYCKGQWDQHYDALQRLRNDMAKVIETLGVKSKEKVPSHARSHAHHYKEIIASLQEQINDLRAKAAQESSKCQNLHCELKGLKGQIWVKSDLEQEILNLREELFKQRMERRQEIEMMKIKKESEIISLQQMLKEEYLQNKQKLLSDLATAQNALQTKNEEEMKLKKKCEQLVREVQTSQDARQKKISELTCPYLTKHKCKVQPEGKSTVHHVIHPLPAVGHIDDYCACATAVAASPVLVNARAKLNSTIEKHRLNAESVPPHCSHDEESNKKYLLK